MMSKNSQYRPRYGSHQSEWVQNPVWEEAIRNNWTGYQLQQHYGLKRIGRDVCRDPSYSAYREDEAGPFWSWERFGRTSTALGDGRIVHIAGEHEDSYDSDFCIYNDVVIEYAGGRLEIYLYPKTEFPPTDFHTATLIGDDILLIGSLGYRDLRRIGETQVMKFNTRTLAFSRVETAGDVPGWISRHRAEKTRSHSILISGGKIETGDGYAGNKHLFELDLQTLTWSRREHGDVAIFPISPEDYALYKSPAYGSANPQRVSNPFWLEMAKRQWPPSRARLHFGDFAPPQPEPEIGPTPPLPDPLPEPGSKEFEAWMSAVDVKLPKLTRTREDVVWTAVRRDPGRLTLPDGRRLIVGGDIADYGDEYADPWNYNDVVVIDSAGDVAVYAYPVEVFPHLFTWVVVPRGGDALIFGNVSRARHPEHKHRFIALRLDTQSFAMTQLSVASPPGFRPNLYPGCAVLRGSSVIFPNIRMTESDPYLGIALDLDTLTWGEPSPHEPPQSTEDDTDG